MGRADAAYIFKCYNKSLYNTALRITASASCSEEIVQETIYKYLTKAPEFELDAQRTKWLKTVCVRASIDWLRKSRRMVSIDKIYEPLDEETARQEEHHSWDEFGADAMKLVMQEIAALGDGYRTVLVLKAIEDYEYSEIASMLGITESTVRSQYLRAKRRVYENVMKRRKKKDGV
ncbi:MAG: sigma-70 family RNA polymerase sigma factor [Bacteroidales bacterium]|nr:sigma-70 family RNA polymerase sigma factor [Bacteroidales bacterium]